MESVNRWSAVWLIAAFLLNLSFRPVGPPPYSPMGSLPANQDDPLWVKFCDLVNHPSKYDQKIVATEAIQVIYTIPALDGNESFLYCPECDTSGPYVLLVSGIPIDPSSEALKHENEIVARARKRKQPARVRALIVGRFHAAKWYETGYGHLGGARFKLEVTGLERVEEVADKTPWPSTFKAEK